LEKEKKLQNQNKKMEEQRKQAEKQLEFIRDNFDPESVLEYEQTKDPNVLRISKSPDELFDKNNIIKAFETFETEGLIEFMRDGDPAKLVLRTKEMTPKEMADIQASLALVDQRQSSAALTWRELKILKMVARANILPNNSRHIKEPQPAQSNCETTYIFQRVNVRMKKKLSIF
jgi:hypothetical protein